MRNLKEAAMTETELRFISSRRELHRIHVRMGRRIREERREAALLWQQAIERTCGVNLALMLLDRCVDCLSRAKALERVLESQNQ
jgi:hypothetical protein